MLLAGGGLRAGGDWHLRPVPLGQRVRHGLRALLAGRDARRQPAGYITGSSGAANTSLGPVLESTQRISIVGRELLSRTEPRGGGGFESWDDGKL